MVDAGRICPLQPSLSCVAAAAAAAACACNGRTRPKLIELFQTLCTFGKFPKNLDDYKEELSSYLESSIEAKRSVIATLKGG